MGHRRNADRKETTEMYLLSYTYQQVHRTTIDSREDALRRAERLAGYDPKVYEADGRGGWTRIA